MQLLDRFKKALAGEGGEALVLEIEREAREKATAHAERRRLDAQIREFERQKKEELPTLRETTAARRAEVDRIRGELLLAQKEASFAASDESALIYSIRQGIERARIGLQRTAWPWLHEAIERAWDRRRDWQNHGWERHRWYRSETALVEADPSDPNHRRMKAYESFYKMERFGSNQAALDALHAEMNRAIEALERLRWRVEEPSREEVARLMEVFSDDTWAARAKQVVWIEPKAPRYDKKGELIAG